MDASPHSVILGLEPRIHAAASHACGSMLGSRPRMEERGCLQQGRSPMLPAALTKKAPALPALMHMRRDQPRIDLACRRHDIGRKRRQIGGGRVGSRLFAVAGAGDHDGDGVAHQNPAQREGRHGGAGRHQLAHLFHRLQANLEGHAGKGLADIEGFAVAVEIAVVVAGKMRLAADLAGEQTACERHAGDDRHVFAACFGKEQVVGALAEDIVDDLDANDAGIFDRLQPVFDLFDADAIALDLAGLLQRVETIEDLGLIEHLTRRAVQLHEVEAVDGKVLEATVDETFEVCLGITFGDMWIEAAARLGGDHRALAATRLQHVGNDFFRAAVAIDVGCIDEGHAGIERGTQRRASVGLADIAPGAADLPGAEADIGDGEGHAAESMVFHDEILPKHVARKCAAVPG
ncbi:hypothetical protein RHECNPAF_8900105 [Rhizobium etli CNPAF512]|nr:hypothetical protein RHECNPAF_8900105 [Rhizobium etli CNPAF512]